MLKLDSITVVLLLVVFYVKEDEGSLGRPV